MVEPKLIFKSQILPTHKSVVFSKIGLASALKRIYMASRRNERSLRLSVRTPGFQPGKRGSIPLGTASTISLKTIRKNTLAFCPALVKSTP